MRHQLISALGFHILILLILAVRAQPQDEMGVDEIKLRQQDSTDIFQLKNKVEQLQENVEILYESSTSEMNILKAIQNTLNNSPANHEACERIPIYFNSTLRKYNQFEDRVMAKLNELQDEQTANINKLMVKQNLSKNCQQSSTLDIMSESLATMSDKINGLEMQLNSMKLATDEQLKLLKDISGQLLQHHEKLEHFETKLPNMIKAPPPEKHALPKNLIFGITQNQKPVKNE